MVLPMTVTTKDKDISAFTDLGITECNWQLFNSDLLDPSKAVSTIQSYGIDVVSLHSPFNDKRIAPLLEYFDSSDFQERVLLAAEEICCLLDKRLPIVFHSALPRYALDVVKRQAEALGPVLEKCPHLDILIENVGMGYPLSYYIHDIPKAIPETVQEFNKYLPRPIYSCLDVCHTEIVDRVGKLIYKEGIIAEEPPAILDFFKEFGASCRLVHFANTQGYGTLRNHGLGFGLEDTEQLKTYLNLCKTYLPQAKIVLEISETDYATRPNLVKTIATLKHIDI